MTNFTDLASVPSDPPVPRADQLRLAVAAYLARFKGSSASTPNLTFAPSSRAALANRCRLAARGVDAQQLIGEPPCCRSGLTHRGQDQVDVPFQTHALNRDEPQNAVWCR